MDDSGFSKGFGFIRFGNEQEQQTAMTSMMGVSGLGSKPIKVSVAVQKDKKYGGGMETMDIPAHLTQAVAQSVIGGSSSQSSSYPSQQSSSSDQYSTDYYTQYSQYWSQYAAWQQYQQQWQQYQAEQAKPAPPPPLVEAGSTAPAAPAPPSESDSSNTKKEEESDGGLFDGPPGLLVDHKVKVKLDIPALNKEYYIRSEELYKSIDQSRWWWCGGD